MKCIQCGKDTGDYKWCSIACKKKFCKENYSGVIMEICEKEIEEERKKYLESPEAKKFDKRIKEIGFCKALRELGEFKNPPIA